MAEKADKLVNDRKRRHQHQDPSSPQSQYVSSLALQDIVKRPSEVVAIQERAANAQLQSLPLTPVSTGSAYTSSHTTHAHMQMTTTSTYAQPFRASTYAQIPVNITHIQSHSANTYNQPSTARSIHTQFFVPFTCW